MRYDKPIILIRKKQAGENSIEEIAYRVAKDLGIEVISVPFFSTHIINLIKNIFFVLRIKAPVVHIITPSEAYLLPFIHGKKIITYHDLGTVFMARNKIYRLARKILHILPSKYFADEITFVSEQTKNEYLKVTKHKKMNRLHVIYNAYDERLIPSGKKNNHIFTILHIGTAKRKNLISTIKACKGLDVKLDIVGKLNEEQLHCLEDNSIQYSNSYDLSYEEIIKKYDSCDIVCFPTFYEGFGVPLIEANAMHKPIIAGDIPVLHEVGGNDAAFFVNPNSIEAIKIAIITLKEDEELRNTYISRGIKNLERFAHMTISKQYEQLYN